MGCLKDLTPEHMRCLAAACPSVHQLEDGRLLIVGDYAGATEAEEAKIPVGDYERAIGVSPALLANVIARG